MNYIKPDQFFKQSKEVQQLFLDNWNPEVGDLIGIKVEYIDLEWNTKFKYKVNCINEDDIFNYDSKKELLDSFKTLGYHNYSDETVPLFTEEQLRKFIEDNTNCIIDIQHDISIGYCFYLFKKNTDILLYKYEDGKLGHNLLQAYWKVACKIAKEIINFEEYTNRMMKQSFINSIHKIINKEGE